MKPMVTCKDCPGTMPCPVNGSMIANTQKGFKCADIEYVHVAGKTTHYYITADCRVQVQPGAKVCPKCGKALSFNAEDIEPKLEEELK